MFLIEKTTGKICYLLSARQLSITWGNTPLYWSWKPIQGSRLVHHPNSQRDLQKLLNSEPFAISINSGMLSLETTYEVYLKVKIADHAYGLDLLPSEVSVEVRKYKELSIYAAHIAKETGKPLVIVIV